MPIRNILIEDLLDAKLKVNSIPKVSKGDDAPVSINSAAGVTYSIEPQEGGRDQFTAVITQLDPGETMTIIVPATVTGAENGYEIDNTAFVTSANGRSLHVRSDTTYHYVTNTQAKIKKVNANGDGLAGASLQILSSDKSQVLIDHITSTTDVMSYDLLPGDYVLHEVSAPGSDYKLAADIPFSIDIEGINKVNNKPVSYVEMVDDPAYKIVFHVNRPGHDDEIFKVYGPADLVSGNKIAHFYDIPLFAGDEYVFAGWYHADGYAASADAATTPADFDSDAYPRSSAENPADYHLYAKWIEVGKIASQDSEDTFNYGNAGIRGFGLAGVQVRDPGMHDTNHNDNETDTTPGGMRFVTSLSESLLSEIDALSDIAVDGDVGVEYGYVVATEQNISAFTRNYHVSDLTKYKLQYNGKNVNGIDTTGLNDKNQRYETTGVLARKDLTADNDFAYVSNVNCTKGTGRITKDHRNFNDYRLYTLIITYEGDDAVKKDQKIDARAYIRYIDANGKVRVFYNDYKTNMYYGGCLCSFNQVKSMARPTGSEWIG